MTIITDYLDALPAAQQPHARQLYAQLQQLLPSAVEQFSYGMPAFAQGGVTLVYFAAHQRWLGFYPTPGPLQALASQLGDWHRTKGAIQFPYAQPLPEAIVAALVRERLVEVAAGTPRPVTRRPVVTLPAALRDQLIAQDLLAAYEARPPYQRTDYVNWIMRAKQAATRVRRADQMLEELRAGDVYMKMPWRARTTKEDHT
ncbi:YdeI/OmpD-associated family protein [Lacticaseibacillus absianus]|uniref:YdeI/OmpD-associated family protein n=1 Tax=Lacticaseibacillus absianus TaxID=2729623 RepID=UPI0015C8258D|nr:YdeI/OmpD-associated family protein [Lacticaseibacillus absianus]